MHLVQQITPFTCGLACLESYFLDVGDLTDQCKMLKDFTAILFNPDPKKSHEYGSTSPDQIEKICMQLGYNAKTTENYDQSQVEAIFQGMLTIGGTILISCYWQGKTMHCVRVSKILKPGLYEIMLTGFPNLAKTDEVKFSELMAWGNNCSPKFLLTAVWK